ncbi:hypothetical protein [Streptomyces alfalfae]
MSIRDDILAGLRASEDTTVGDATPEQILDAYKAEVLRERPVIQDPQREAEIREQVASAIYPTYGQENRNRSLAIADLVMPAVREVVAELAAVRAERDEARARVRELERRAVEAHRNEIRQSYAELAAAAHETRDYEGAFDVECRLREREEQWRREDTATTP